MKWEDVCNEPQRQVEHYVKLAQLQGWWPYVKSELLRLSKSDEPAYRAIREQVVAQLRAQGWEPPAPRQTPSQGQFAPSRGR